MSFAGPPHLRSRGCIGLTLLLTLGVASGAATQELPLKRDVPGDDPVRCPELPSSRTPLPEEIEQAVRLASDAEQALLLGDQTRARDLLARATELDPTSADLAYRYGRTLESLGESAAALEQFCRVAAADVEEEMGRDARARLESLGRDRGSGLPQEAVDEFRRGLRNAEDGELRRAEDAFGTAFSVAPTWADAVYNRGVVRDRLGDAREAAADLQSYLALAPDAADVLTVSQRIGQLQSPMRSSVSPGSAFALGLLIPGMGQFYSGRALGGFGVLTLAGGAAAAGFLVQKEEIACVGSPAAGGECPDDRVISRETSHPYLAQGLVAAGVVAVAGAIEAYFHARGSGGDGVAGFDEGDARRIGIAWPSVSSRNRILNLSLLRVTF